MSTPEFLRSLLDLANCESVDALLDAVITLLERDLKVRGCVELWDGAGIHVSAGALFLADTAHCTWIGIRHTIGAIRLEGMPPEPGDVELLATQIAPLAELLLEYDAAQRRTIHDEIDRVYERRIHEALTRHDWNVTAVARELGVGRMRVIDVMRRLRSRLKIVSG